MCCMGCFRSQYFLLQNGVKQGGVLSPIFVTIYIDKLLVMLRTTGIGCHLGSAYSGALSADDITLLCQSVRGLNEMIVLCCEYAKEYDITINKLISKFCHLQPHILINLFKTY